MAVYEDPPDEGDEQVWPTYTKHPAARQARESSLGKRWKKLEIVRKRNAFLTRINGLLDGRIPRCHLGAVPVDVSPHPGRGRLVPAYLYRPDLIEIASRHPDLRAKDIARLPQIMDEGAVFVGLGRLSRTYITFIPRSQIKGLVVELAVDKRTPTSHCVDYRRQYIGSIRQLMSDSCLIVSQQGDEG